MLLKGDLAVELGTLFKLDSNVSLSLNHKASEFKLLLNTSYDKNSNYIYHFQQSQTSPM